MPGAYAEVAFHLNGNRQSLVVPSNTLIFRSPGAQVAIVENNQAHLRDVKIGRDFGATLEIVSGLHDTDEVILNPPDSLSDGQTVAVQRGQEEPIQPPPAAEAGH
jgi:hypothetical protein